MHPSADLLAGRYQLRRRIGAGGMGEVWLALDERLDREVAVKVMRAALLEDPEFLSRFRAEARAMARVAHPGVVAVHDFDQDTSGTAFLVMAYVPGESLYSLLRRERRLPPGRTFELIAGAAEALHAAHEQGVVHRDVKPANLLVRPDGAVVLTDFGVARMQEGTQLTATGMLIGTFSYLAPEQVLGETATARSDVYALGVVAHECLTGQRPFDRDSPAATMMSRLQAPPPTLPATIPLAVCTVLERALATDPAMRWESALDLAAACRTALATQPTAGATPVPPPLAPIPPPIPVARSGNAPTPRTATRMPAPEPWLLGFDQIVVALPNHETAGYTFRSTHAVPHKAAGARTRAPTFLTRAGRLQVCSSPESLLAMVRSGEPHDLAHIGNWQIYVESLSPQQIDPDPHDVYELDLVLPNLQGPLEAWTPPLIISAAEFARDLGHSLGLAPVMTALASGSVLDRLDDALRMVEAGVFHSRRRLRRFDPREVGTAWHAVIWHLERAIDWRD